MAYETQRHNISKNNFEQCTKCSICTTVCPVMAADEKYPGPKQAGPDQERYRLKNPEYFETVLKMCLNCKRCEVACPSGVNIGDIIQSARIDNIHGKPSLRDFALANTDLTGGIATLVAPIANFALGLQPVKAIMHSALGVDKHRQLPAYAAQKFETWFKRHAAEQEAFDRKVAYFHGCYVNYNYPQLGKDFVKVMNALGYGVRLLEKEKCCGIALIANDQAKQAKTQGIHNIKIIGKALAENCEAVLTTSSTCTFTMRDEYPHLLGIDNDSVRDRISLATRFIFRLLDDNKAELRWRKDFRMRVAYHSACHMERMGWTVYSTELLRKIPGLELVVLDSQCCGISGTYGFKTENYERSQKIGEGLFRQICEVNPDFVATDCETCKWQIEMSTSYKVLNPISILAQALE